MKTKTSASPNLSLIEVSRLKKREPIQTVTSSHPVPLLTEKTTISTNRFLNKQVDLAILLSQRSKRIMKPQIQFTFSCLTTISPLHIMRGSISQKIMSKTRVIM